MSRKQSNGYHCKDVIDPTNGVHEAMREAVRIACAKMGLSGTG
jgi:hypothetical protein